MTPSSLLGRVFPWQKRSLQTARQNAQDASADLARRRREREDADRYVAWRTARASREDGRSQPPRS